jgi:hypothetical protein
VSQTSGKRSRYWELASLGLMFGTLKVSSGRLKMADLHIFGKIPG